MTPWSPRAGAQVRAPEGSGLLSPVSVLPLAWGEGGRGGAASPTAGLILSLPL